MVTLGAALIMVVSKYGFQDIPALEMMKVDASRVASNVVTGVGFLGAGVIFFPFCKACAHCLVSVIKGYAV